jgi:4-hydroxybenzoyl-CoA reductase subunit beta
VAIALGAQIRLVGPGGERLIPAAALYRDDGMEFLTKTPEEILTEIVLPPADGWRTTYWKLRRRGSFDFPILGVAAALRQAPDGTVEDARIARVAQVAFQPAKPLDNADLTIGYRKKMARVYIERALRELAGLPFDGGPGGGAH